MTELKALIYVKKCLDLDVAEGQHSICDCAQRDHVKSSLTSHRVWTSTSIDNFTGSKGISRELGVWWFQDRFLKFSLAEQMKVPLQKNYRRRRITSVFSTNSTAVYHFLWGGKMKTTVISNQVLGSSGNSLYMLLVHLIIFGKVLMVLARKQN